MITIPWFGVSIQTLTLIRVSNSTWSWNDRQEMHAWNLWFERTMCTINHKQHTCSINISVSHGMFEDHFIEYIYAKDASSGSIVAAIKLALQDAKTLKPSITFVLPKDIRSIVPFAFCNKHGLWKGNEFQLVWFIRNISSGWFLHFIEMPFVKFHTVHTYTHMLIHISSCFFIKYIIQSYILWYVSYFPCNKYYHTINNDVPDFTLPSALRLYSICFFL